MSEDHLQRTLQNCCRLCLAPGTECISILNSYAADKEPLTTKIYNCVCIKITSTDRLSLRICHACISYLNSWQSFKNRCLNSQIKQQQCVASNINDEKYQQQQPQQTDDYSDPQAPQSSSNLASSILDGISSLKKRKSLTVYVSEIEKQQQLQQQKLIKQQQQQQKQRQIKKQKQLQFSEILLQHLNAPINKKPQAEQQARKYKKYKEIKLQQQQHEKQPRRKKQIQQQQQQQQQKAQLKEKQQQQQQEAQLEQQPKQPQEQKEACSEIASTPHTAELPSIAVTPMAATVDAPVALSDTAHIIATLPIVSPTASSLASPIVTPVVAPCGSSATSAGGALSDDASTSTKNAIQQLRFFRRCSYNNPLPAVDIKDEPAEYEENNEYGDDIMDPTLFLERTEEEGDEPILSSTTYNFAQQAVNNRPALEISTTTKTTTTRAPRNSETKEAACRACNLKFSTRANARRHERNLHPSLFDVDNTTMLKPSTTPMPPMAPPPPALAAALELQRVGENNNMSQQKMRQEVINAANQAGNGGYDYDNPDKYRSLLTDEKIVFLQQNAAFLMQYQNMACRCCNKVYATYKNFMAHMRKKFPSLPRNLCFSCLKLNDSKALFISHLKRRNCINLFKVLQGMMAKNSDFAEAVENMTAQASERLKAKDLLVNKIYECKLCPKHFRLKLEFRSHVYKDHPDMQRKDAASTQCAFCGLEMEDPAETKRHFNNMDCIVSLRCGTCRAKFDKLPKFLEHVYQVHLSNIPDQPVQHSVLMDTYAAAKSGGSSSAEDNRNNNSAIQFNSSPMNVQRSQYFSRMPQTCPICGQQYNNYNNVLRHMESKHPDQLPQTYKCVKCGKGFPRLSNLREHMNSAHVMPEKIQKNTSFEYIVNAETVKTDGSPPSSNVYTGRYDYVMKDLLSITNGSIKEEDENDGPEQLAKKMRMDASPSSGLNSSNQLKECGVCNAIFSNNIGLSNHMRSHTSAAQNAAVAAAATKAANNSIINSNPTTNVNRIMSTSALQQQQRDIIQKRSLDQAADRRFRRMRCRICQRRFSSKKSYRFHMMNDHQIRNVQFIKCKLCDAEFAYEKGLKVHMFKIHNTLLKDSMIIKQYECDICSIVYRTEVELKQHKITVHGDENAQAADFEETLGADNNSTGADMSGISTPVSTTGVGVSHQANNSTPTGPLYWYQCKYCPSNFNTNKKLAIHVNSHDEFDSNDYSCKDCGNVYSGRKSLWVHRYKKHPQIAEPSECVLCKKVFFDSQMLQNHIPTCNRKPITATGATLDATNATRKHKTGDDEDDVSRGLEEDNIDSKLKLNIKLPEVACTICGQRFTDQDLFSKHIEMHQMELYTDNPLAAMFDTGPADPNQFYLDRVNDNGEYACDICTKTFSQMTALKVHRKWHFRGDSKQTTTEADPSAANSMTNSSQTQIFHPHQLGLQAVNHLATKSQKRKRELKCEFCPSTFISNNNLRRHIYELHKDAIGNLPEPPKIELDPHLMCRRCEIKFDTKAEWLEHKIADARIMRPFGPFQWGCDLCGAYVSRKEKLINHIHNHMKDRVILPVEQQKKEELDGSQEVKVINDVDEIKKEVEEEDEEEEEEDEEDEDDENENDEEEGEGEGEYFEAEEHDYGVIKSEDSDGDAGLVVNEDDNANDGENDDGDEADSGDEDDEADESSNDNTRGEAEEDSYVEEDSTMSSSDELKPPPPAKTYPCDLCQKKFDSHQALQSHVKAHFLNGPAGAISKSSSDKSRSSSTDMVAV